MREQALAASTDEEVWEIIIRRARAVMRAYSTSFFIVTRFLPPAKRARVEAIYAAVRYPDEIVDTFPVAAIDKIRKLDDWAAQYETALDACSIRDTIENGASCFVASFTKVVREAGIPTEHYRAFLDAMRLDAQPRKFATLDDLIQSYIYGSAIVVGYFLAHIYGPSRESQMDRALLSARNLVVSHVEFDG